MSKQDFRFHINVFQDDNNIDETSLLSQLPVVPEDVRASFKKDGFAIFGDVLHESTVQALNGRLEEILRGRYDRNCPPDKVPRLIKGELQKDTRSEACKGGRGNKATVAPLGFSGNLQNVKVLQVINTHKADRLFRAVATNASLGKVVANLMDWENGARLAQDQVWAKPPGAASLSFHRDSPYFMFSPPDVATVWVALDDMDEELGPLEYVKGSHLWGDGRIGSSSQFFQNDRYSLLKSAAAREGVDFANLDIISMAGLKAGGISIHNGRTWHGSSKNESRNRPRRGLGLHFVPAEVKFTEDASKSRLWKQYVRDIEDIDFSKVELPEEDFPVVWKEVN